MSSPYLHLRRPLLPILKSQSHQYIINELPIDRFSYLVYPCNNNFQVYQINLKQAVLVQTRYYYILCCIKVEFNSWKKDRRWLGLKVATNNISYAYSKSFPFILKDWRTMLHDCQNNQNYNLNKSGYNVSHIYILRRKTP